MAKKKTTKGMREATVWKLQLEMWDWMVEQGVTSLDVGPLKWKWCKEHDYNLRACCFFCDYAWGQDRIGSCKGCPGRMVHKTFNCEACTIYDEDPIAFHAKLHRMNKKRLAMRKK